MKATLAEAGIQTAFASPAVTDNVQVVLKSVPNAEPENLKSKNGITAYTGDMFIISAEGRLVGEDGFEVPMNFTEFEQRYPVYIRNWVVKTLHKTTIDDDVLDWTQDLSLHMRYLPETSVGRKPGYNNRAAGCTDLIECFNPIAQYGASARRFFNYVNLCLRNKFTTIQSKNSKNPILQPGNIAYSPSNDVEERPEVGNDEFIHANSERLKECDEDTEKRQEQKLFVDGFLRFVERRSKRHPEEAELIPMIAALKFSDSMEEAMEMLHCDLRTFLRNRKRLKLLADCYQRAAIVPSWRKPYQRRTKNVEVSVSIEPAAIPVNAIPERPRQATAL